MKTTSKTNRNCKTNRFTSSYFIFFILIVLSASVSYAQFNPSPIVFGQNFIDDDCEPVGIDICPNFIGGMLNIASRNTPSKPYFVVQSYERTSPYSLNSDLQSYALAHTYFMINEKGSVGIGTDDPKSKFHVSNGASGLSTPHSFADIVVEDDDYGMMTILTPNNRTGFYGFADRDDDYVGGLQYNHADNSMHFRVNNFSFSSLMINNQGNVGIGTTSPTEKLDVDGNAVIQGDLTIKDANGDNQFKIDDDGNVRAREIKVDLATIPDYVFAEDYELMPLEEVATFIEENHHLPNVKSEADYQEEGSISLTEMNLKLLEKVEELTLYTLQQQEELNALKSEIENLKK